MLQRLFVLAVAAVCFVPLVAADEPKPETIKALVTKLGAEKESDRDAKIRKIRGE